MKTKITFFRVKDNASKIKLIVAKAQEAFSQEKRLLITVPAFEAAQYIDALLWRMPEDGFLPHVLTDFPSAEWIVITMQDRVNLNQASRLLNLNPHSSPLYQQFEDIYELQDETHPQKLEQSQKRFQDYKAKGCLVFL